MNRVNKFFIFLIIFINFLIIPNINAESNNTDGKINLDKFIDFPHSVESDFRFFGLAGFYNQTNFFISTQDKLLEVPAVQTIKLNNNEKLIIKRRDDLIILTAPGSLINIKDKKIVNVTKIDYEKSSISFVNNHESSQFDLLFRQYRYNKLIFPLNKLSLLIEDFLILLNAFFNNLGASIIFFALLIKVVLYPLSRALFKSQQKVFTINNIINPKLQDIKNSYHGEDRHFKVLEMYKKLGISPNYKIYPALIALIQIPILISIFNTLGEMPQVSAQRFLWIADLSRPDMISFLPFSIPFLGNSFNFLPLLMSIFVFLSGVLYIEDNLDTYQKKSKIKQSFFMAAIFFVIFYPFPASMVLYWAASNFFNIAQQRILFSK